MTLSRRHITAVCRCTSPQNKPLTSEILHCRAYLLKESQLLKKVQVIIGLGKNGFDDVIQCIKQLHQTTLKEILLFGHRVEYRFNKQSILLGSLHPSQQNTFTGRLTVPMLDSVFYAFTAS